MFQLTKEEFNSWRSQIVMSKSDEKSLRHYPFAFKEQGVAMLSSVLKSERVISINIMIMRAFAKLRELISTHKKVEEKLRELESRLKEHDEQIVQIIQVINQLIAPPQPPKRKMGFGNE